MTIPLPHISDQTTNDAWSYRATQQINQDTNRIDRLEQVLGTGGAGAPVFASYQSQEDTNLLSGDSQRWLPLSVNSGAFSDATNLDTTINVPLTATYSVSYKASFRNLAAVAPIVARRTTAASNRQLSAPNQFVPLELELTELFHSNSILYDVNTSIFTITQAGQYRITYSLTASFPAVPATPGFANVRAIVATTTDINQFGNPANRLDAITSSTTLRNTASVSRTFSNSGIFNLPANSTIGLGLTTTYPQPTQITLRTDAVSHLEIERIDPVPATITSTLIDALGNPLVGSSVTTATTSPISDVLYTNSYSGVLPLLDTDTLRLRHVINNASGISPITVDPNETVLSLHRISS